ncbi:MAG: O-antigen ligase family protein [Rubrivivax sp.]|nr:O-antigen ligase family protein [Rubrivivax sp.]
MPWLLPTRTEPWTTFYADALAAAVWLSLTASLLATTTRSALPAALTGRGVALDLLPALALALMLVAGLQAFSGRLVFASEAVLVGAHLAAFAGAAVLGRHCRELVGETFTHLLWTSLIAAALLSAGIGVAQWLKVEPLDWLTPPADVDGRAIANVGQANHLATLICWGLLGLWQARLRGQLGPWITALAAAFLAFGLALTQSRTPWVGAVVLFAVAVLGHRALGGRRTLWALLALVAFYVLSWQAMAEVSEALGLTAPRDAADQTSAGFRPTIWAIAVAAIAERPWLGWGWNQFGVAWVALAPGRLAIPSPNGYAHNLVLDLLVWNGVLIGGLVVAVLLGWMWRMLRAARSAEQWLLLAGVGVFGVHALLELPHAYLLMLLPVAGMMGVLSACAPLPPLARLRRRWVAGAGLGLAALLALIVRDYHGLEADHQALRLKDAGLLIQTPHAPSQPIVLRWMAEANATLQARPAQNMTAEELTRLRRTLARYPNAGGLARYAQASALHGDAAGAAWALHTLCGLQRRAVCEAALREWQTFAARHPEAPVVAMPQPAAR